MEPLPAFVEVLPRPSQGAVYHPSRQSLGGRVVPAAEPTHNRVCALIGAAAAVASACPRRRGLGRSLISPRSSCTSVLRRAAEDLDLGMSSELVVKVPGYDQRKTGILLLNIGTPASTSVEDVREYLDKFLADDRVIEIQPPLLKWLILQILLISRPKSSAENYKKIWDPVRGSPLLFHSQDLANGLQQEMGDRFMVRIGMQYSAPTVDDSLKELAEAGVDNVILVPMFPHYASGTTGSCLAGAYRTAAELYCTPFLSVLPPFYGHRHYVEAMKQNMLQVIGPKGENVDHTLFSFHGLPEEQCSRTDTTGIVCNKTPNCCAQLTKANRNCYRAQCFETARLLAYELGLDKDKWSIGFQSRLTLRGAIQWIKPYTDKAFVELAEKGVRRLAVVAPSFTADCVETLEELGITGREEFAEAGGEEIVLVPCLNSSDYWVDNMSQILREFMALSAGEAPAPPVESATLDNGKSMVPGIEVGVSPS